MQNLMLLWSEREHTFIMNCLKNKAFDVRIDRLRYTILTLLTGSKTAHRQKSILLLVSDGLVLTHRAGLNWDSRGHTASAGWGC